MRHRMTSAAAVFAISALLSAGLPAAVRPISVRPSAVSEADSLPVRPSAVPAADSLLVLPTDFSVLPSQDSVALVPAAPEVPSSSSLSDTLASPAAAPDTLAVPSRPRIGEEEMERLLARADSLRGACLFSEAADLCESLLDEVDSLMQPRVEERLILAENGQRMMSFVCSPAVVARHRFALADFFLFYPFADRSWSGFDPGCGGKSFPGAADVPPFHHGISLQGHSEGDSGASADALSALSGSCGIYFSALDETGARNIYRTGLQDSLWTVPALLNEHITSAGDEVFPLLSADGRRLYFSSNGLYGVGGHDLYVCEWDDSAQDWGVPANLGFPFSSPANDYLYYDTPDGRYTIFASDRDCPADSVNVYVLEYENMPARKPAESVLQLRELLALEPLGDMSRMDAGKAVAAPVTENEDVLRYMEQNRLVRSLRDSLYTLVNTLDRARSEYALSSDVDERDRLTGAILSMEASMPALNAELSRAVAKLQEIEFGFLFSGGQVIDLQKMAEAADVEVVGASLGYTFAKMNMGEPLSLNFMQPEEPDFDFIFDIGEAAFAEDGELPGGVIYQIQLFALAYDASLRDLRGLSPVYVERSPSGRRVYRAGLFRRYPDVLARLNDVRKLGFRNAFITAYIDGVSVPVSRARDAEAAAETSGL